MGMREQAIEEVRVYCGGAGDAPMLHTAHHFAERALTAEVALAEARILLMELNASREFALYITPESKFGVRLNAWLERNKKEA